MKAIFVCIVLAVFVSAAQAWNTGAMVIDAVMFEKGGKIRFQVFEEGSAGDIFLCSAGSPWFVIEACSDNNSQCLAAVDRMSSMLLAAKLSGAPVNLERSECLVTETAMSRP